MVIRTIFALPLMLGSAAALAQTGTSTAIGNEPVRLEGDRVPAGPAGRSENFIHGVDFDLNVSEEDSKASIAFGGYSTRNIYAGEAARQLSQSWSVRLSVPVGGGDDITSDSTLEALGDGPKLTFSYGLFGFKAANINSPRFIPLMDRARIECERQATTPQQIEFCRMAPPDRRFATRYSGASRREINKSLFSGLWRAGLDVSLGVNRFEFVEPLTLTDRKTTKFQYSAGLFGAWYPADGMSGIIGRAEYQRAFEAADDVIQCKAVVVNPNDDCKKGAPQAPHRVQHLNLSIEGRRVFNPDSKSGSLAISPRATVDALSGDYELELPIYFMPRWDLPVSPGVSVGYVSHKDKVTFGLFLRTSFSFD